MTRDEIRLECLKLSHNFVHSTKDILARASEYESFVVGKPESSETVSSPAEKRKPGRPPKSGDNPGILD